MRTLHGGEDSRHSSSLRLVAWINRVQRQRGTDRGGSCGGPNVKERYIKALRDRLVAEGWDHLVFLPGSGMHGDDTEGTVDGGHPNDIGMINLAKAYGAAVAEALGLVRRF